MVAVEGPDGGLVVMCSCLNTKRISWLNEQKLEVELNTSVLESQR